jgi:hypothetical protein
MTQLRKRTAERTALIGAAGKERSGGSVERETGNKTDASGRAARGVAQAERTPGGNPPSGAGGSTPDVDSLVQSPPEAAGEEEEHVTAVMGAQGEIEPDDKKPPVKEPPEPENDKGEKKAGKDRRPDGGPLDPAGSFVPGAVLPSTVPNASPNLKKKLNDMPNAADDPDREKIPPELKI